MPICLQSVLCLKLLLLLMMWRWRGRRALALWLQCLSIITPRPAASSLFRHFILKMLRSNLKVTAHIGAQDTTLNRSCTQTISWSGVWVLKTVLSFLKAVLVQVGPSKIHNFFSINSDELLNASTLNKHCFVCFSVLNLKHVWQTQSHYLCLWFFLRAWSSMFIPTGIVGIVLNLSKHSCLAVQSSACNTKRYNHYILTLIMPVSAPLLEGFMSKKEKKKEKKTPARFTESLSKCTHQESGGQRLHAVLSLTCVHTK